MVIFITAVFAFICMSFVFALAGVVFRFILEIVGPGILVLLGVRFLTMMMEHWMGSTIAWTLSIIAGLWVVYKKVKKLLTDPHSFMKDMRERDNRMEHDKEEFNQWYKNKR